MLRTIIQATKPWTKARKEIVKYFGNEYSSNQLITTGIMNAQSQGKLLSYFKSSGKQFNFVNYVALIQQLVKNREHDSYIINEIEFAKIMTGFQKIVANEMSELTGRNLSNAYSKLSKARQLFQGQTPPPAYFEMMDLLEEQLYIRAEELNQQELSDTLSILTRKAKIKPLEAKLVELAMNQLEEFYTTTFLFHVVDHLGWRPEIYAPKMDILATHILKILESDQSSLVLKDFSIILMNYGRITSKTPTINRLLGELVRLLDSILDTAHYEQIGTLCFAIDQLQGSDFHEEALDKLRGHVTKNKKLYSTISDKSAIMNLLYSFGLSSDKGKMTGIGTVYQAMTKLPSFTAEDIKSVLNSYLPPKTSETKQSVQTFIELQLGKLKETHRNTVNSKTFARILKGLIYSNNRKLVLTFEAHLNLLKLFNYSLEHSNEKELLNDYSYIIYACQTLKDLHKEEQADLHPILTRIFLKAYYLFVKGEFDSDPDINDPEKLSIFVNLLAKNLSLIEEESQLKEMFAAKVAELTSKNLTPENLFHLAIQSNNTLSESQVPESEESNIYEEFMTPLNDLVTTKNIKKDVILKVPKKEGELKDLLEFLCKNIGVASKQNEEGNPNYDKLVIIQNPRASISQITQKLRDFLSNQGLAPHSSNNAESSANKRSLISKYEQKFSALN